MEPILVGDPVVWVSIAHKRRHGNSVETRRGKKKKKEKGVGEGRRMGKDRWEE